MPRTVALVSGRVWLRVADPAWQRPLDPSYAEAQGGRWNPPRSFPTLYLNADVLTARLQIERLCEGTAVTPDDLTDDAYVLVAATLPSSELAADAVSDAGLRALGLPDTYPVDPRGARIARAKCAALGVELERQGLGGVWCRSACSDDGRGRELAWFSRGRSASEAWAEPLPFGVWRYAESFRDLGVDEQPQPA